jgi:hypothetical protein
MDEDDGNLSPSRSQSFIVKFWTEDMNGGYRRAALRGQITHVPSGERRYLRSPGEILSFIIPYLEAIGAKIPLFCRFLQWLWRRKPGSTGSR